MLKQYYLIFRYGSFGLEVSRGQRKFPGGLNCSNWQAQIPSVLHKTAELAESMPCEKSMAGLRIT